MSFLEHHFAESLATLSRAAASTTLSEAVGLAADACTRCLNGGGKLLLAGNGGSAGDAQHIAGEFLSRLNFDRPPLAALALSTDTSVLTAVGNDYGFEHVFERQILGLARPDDVFIAISTSGRSPNILLALKAAQAAQCVTIGVGGIQADMASFCDIFIEIPSRSTPAIQQVYMVVAHALCGEVERRLCAKPEPSMP